jgi:hypothetical protein
MLRKRRHPTAVWHSEHELANLPLPCQLLARLSLQFLELHMSGLQLQPLLRSLQTLLRVTSLLSFAGPAKATVPPAFDAQAVSRPRIESPGPADAPGPTFKSSARTFKAPRVILCFEPLRGLIQELLDLSPAF